MFWPLFIFCILQRVFELFLSKSHQGILSGRGFEEKESAWSLWLMILLHAGWFVSMLGESIVFPIEITPGLWWLLIGVFVSAQALRIWTIKTLGHHWNISVWSPKVGGADRSSEFVAKGPYRFIRHPNYLAVVMEFISLPLIGGAFWTSVVFSVANFFVLKNRIYVEEKFLFSRPGYQEIMGPKARFIPGLI